MSVTIHTIQSSDWPAWVQAIGSVIAIFVAGAVPYFTIQHERHRYRNAGLGLAREAVAAIGFTARNCGIEQKEPIDAVVAERESYELVISVITGYMKQFPVDRLGHAGAVKAFLRLTGAAGNAIELSRAIQGGGGDRKALAALQTGAHERLSELETALKPRKGFLRKP